MSASTVFSLVNPLAMIMWVLLILAPNWKYTKFLRQYKIIPIILSVIYLVYIVQSIATTGLDFGSLESVMELFTHENAVLAGWVHYLAFDLLVGMWILDQNESIKIHHLLIIPCLLLTFMLGPVGFLLFLIIKTIKN